MPWSRDAVRILPAKIDLAKQPWCRNALLLQIQGTGILRWESRPKPPEVDPYESDCCLTLRGTPLLSGRLPGCGTSQGRLSAGWGLDTADCPELETLRAVLDGGFAGLEPAVPALSPLLELLPAGLYVLAEGDAYPADGGGRFFWDVPDALTLHPAAGMPYLNDEDYDFEYQKLPPVYLYPSQKRSRLDPDRVAYYRSRFRQGGPSPYGVALYVTEGVSVLLDGHHKAAAAALLGRSLPCLTVIRLEHYQIRPVTVPPLHREAVVPRRYEEYAGCFGPITIPLEDMGGVKPPKEPWVFAKGAGPLPEGRLADAELPEELRVCGKRYPTAEGYALVTAAGIGYPSGAELETWLADISLHRPKLRAALVLLRTGDDPRLKETALRCAAVEDRYCSLKAEAFRILAEMKGDPEAEAFFIDYFVSLPYQVPGGKEQDLTEIAHSFWN